MKETVEQFLARGEGGSGGGGGTSSAGYPVGGGGTGGAAGGGGGGGGDLPSYTPKIERLKLELEETRERAAREYAEMSKLPAGFERDALRYQWLRNSKPRHGYASVTAGDLRYTGTYLDELIDQELEHEK